MLNRIFIILSALSFFIAPQLAHGQAPQLAHVQVGLLYAANALTIAQEPKNAEAQKELTAEEKAKLEKEQAEAQDAARKDEMFLRLKERMSIRSAQLKDEPNTDTLVRRKKNLDDMVGFSERIAKLSSTSADGAIQLGAQLREMLVKFTPSELAVFRININSFAGEILAKNNAAKRFFEKELKEFNDKIKDVEAGDSLETQQQNIKYLIDQANAEKEFLEKNLSALDKGVSPATDCNTAEAMEARKLEIDALREAVESMLKDNVLTSEEAKKLAELESKIAPFQTAADKKAENVKGAKAFRDSESDETNKAALSEIVEGLEADLAKLNADLAPLKTEADAIKAKRLPYEWLKRQLDRQVLALEACMRQNPSVNDSASQGLPRSAPGTPAPTPAPGPAPAPAPVSGSGDGTIGS